MYLMVGRAQVFFLGVMLFSLVIIIASIRWIRDLNKIKKKNNRV